MGAEGDVEVVISGIGGSFPQSANVEEFKRAIMEKIELSVAARWKIDQYDVCNRTMNIHNFDRFDASYFSVHRRQAYFMDPMHRIALENSFEALIDAGVNPLEARGTTMAVFTGSSISENDSLMFEAVESGFGVTGQARTMCANRISYYLNVTGPSCTFYSSWLGGLEVIQKACEVIRSGECESALVGVTNLNMNICPTHVMTMMGLLSSDGKTKAFSENTDGYNRSESIIFLFLQRADVAKRHYATILHAEVTFDGIRSGQLLNYNADNMVRFIEKFYQTAGVDPADVQYLETYGCGIKSVDEAELYVLDKVYNKNRKGPLAMGSIKTIAGHGEPAANFLGIVKVLLAMETDVIPGDIDYGTRNTNIPSLVNGRFEIFTENKPMELNLAAVNALGLSSSYGHILLKGNSRRKQSFQCDIPILSLFSTRNEAGINKIVEIEKSNTEVDLEYVRLVHDVFRENVSGHMYRGYVNRSVDVKHEISHFEGSKKEIWFIYSGMGSQWCTMGKELMRLPIFAQAVQKCHNVLLEKDLDLLKIITEDDKSIFNDILHSFVGIAAIQIGLTDVLRAINIVPDGIIGHSVGELGCAYADGCLTAEQMILSAYYRGRASQEVELITGMMAAIGVGAQKIKKTCPRTIDVACHNGPDSSTLSGPKEDMEKFVAELQAQNVFAKLVNVSNIAYHSRYIKPAAPLLLEYLRKMIPNPIARSSKWISTSVPEARWDTDLAKNTSAEYLTNNLLSSVYFEEGCTHIPPNAIAIEIAPHGLLQAILRRSLPSTCVHVPLTKRGIDDGLEFLFSAFGKLYMNGLNMQISNLYPPVTFPVTRGTKSLAPLVYWAHDEVWRTGIEEFMDNVTTERNYEVNLTCEEFRGVMNHVLDDQIVIPVVAYLPLVCKLLSNIKRVDNAVFENIVVQRHRTILEKGFIPPIRIMVHKGSGYFEIDDRYGIIATGRISVPENIADEMPEIPPVESNEDYFKFKSADIYREFHDRGYKYNGPYQALREVNLYDDGMSSKIEWKNDWVAFVVAMIQLHILHAGEGKQNLLIPNYIRRIVINFDELLTSDEVLHVNYHYATKTIKSTSVQIHDIQYDNPATVERPLSADNLKFLEYSFGAVANLQTGIDIAIKIVQQSKDSNHNLCEITEIKNNNAEMLTSYVKNISERSLAKKIYINVVEEVSDNIPLSSLVIVDERYLQHANAFLSKITEYVLTYVPITQQCIFEYPVLSVFSFVVGNYQYHLLKKAYTEVPRIIHAKWKSNSALVKDVSSEWFLQLQTALNNVNQEKERIYLVSHSVPSTGIENLIRQIKTLRNADCVRLLLILDTTAPEFSPSDPFYQPIFQKDLLVSIFNDGAWGSYFLTPLLLTNEGNIYKNTMITGNTFSKMVSNYRVKYIGVNAHSCIPNYQMDKHDIGPVEFAGEDRSGKRIMGIARAELSGMEVTPDPELVWPLPEKWDYIDGATVPFAYSMAYYVLMEKTNIQAGETVLIHNGCSSFGQAAIIAALKHSCIVYTSVASEKQKVVLQENMKQLAPHQIVDYTDPNLDIKILLATHGLGVDVIINTLTEDHLQASMRCLKQLGRIVQIEVSEADRLNSVGLKLFLTCVGMHGVVPGGIFDWPRDVKRRIHSYVSEALKHGKITPLRRTMTEYCTIDNALRYLKGTEVTGTIVLPVLKADKASNGFKKFETCITPKCNKTACYLIYGTDADMLINAVEKLIALGARKVIICSEIKTRRNYVHRRLGLLQHYHDANIKLISNNDKRSLPTLAIYHEIQLYGPISTVIILPHSDLAENVKLVASVDDVLQSVAPKAHMVCFWATTVNVNYRKDSSVLVSNIRWDRRIDFNRAVNVLDEILVNSADLFVKNNIHDDTSEENFSYKDFFLLLSRSVDSLPVVANSISRTVDLIQLASNAPPVAKDSEPVFIVPGILGHTCKFFKAFLRKVMSPAYVVNLYDSNESIENVAMEIVQKMKGVSNGPYNILGISFGGALAMEIAKVLESQKERIQLYLIDAIPDTIKSIVTDDGRSNDFETNLILELLQLKRPEDIRSLFNSTDWPERLSVGIRSMNFSKRENEKLEQTLNFLRSRLQSFIQYKSPEQVINSTVRLLRPKESSKDCTLFLSKYCKELKIEIMKGNHFSMLESDELAEYVHEHIIIRQYYEY